MGLSTVQFPKNNTSGSGVVVTTASNLLLLQSTNSLVTGQVYEFPYECVNKLQGTIGNVYISNGNDTLQITATSSSTFSTRVNSVLFPDLIIEFTFTQPTGWAASNWYGFITRLEDTSKDINIGGDYRFIKWRRWDNGSGQYVVTSDNGNAFMDVLWSTNIATNIFIDDLQSTFANTCVLNNQVVTNINFTNNSFTGCNLNRLVNSTISNSIAQNLKFFCFSGVNANQSLFNNVQGQFTSDGLIDCVLNSFTLQNITQIGSFTSYTCNEYAIQNITLLNSSNAGFLDNGSLTGITILTLANTSLLNSGVGGVTTCQLSNTTISNYSFTGSDFRTNYTPAISGNVAFKLAISAGQANVSYYFNTNQASVIVGANTLFFIPLKWKLKNKFINAIGVTGTGTVQIGTATYPNLIQAVTVANVLPAQQFATDLTTDYQAVEQSLIFTKSDNTINGNIELFLTFNIKQF